jgi:putative nucleotidyltransferase with HDIG domain
MGRFKPLLPLGPTTVVERLVERYRSAGIEDICVVAGHRAAELQAVLQPLGVRGVVNPDPDAGMYSSLVVGVRALPADCRAFFVHPVDIPLVRRATLAALAQAFALGSAQVCHPCFDGRRGHPPLVSAELAPEILSWRGQGGLRAFWENHALAVEEVPVADAAILQDLDTEVDYLQMAAGLATEDIPTEDECRVLMTRVAAVPPAVWQHCRAVTEVALSLAGAANSRGARLNLDLVRAAGLLHDIAKTKADHASAGAQLLAGLNYPRVAAAVAVHMDLDTDPDQPLDEAQLVFLADKLFEGEHLAGLESRLARKMAKYGRDPEARAAIACRFLVAAWIAAKLARITGRSLEALLPRDTQRQE